MPGCCTKMTSEESVDLELMSVQGKLRSVVIGDCTKLTTEDIVDPKPMSVEVSPRRVLIEGIALKAGDNLMSCVYMLFGSTQLKSCPIACC